MLTETKYIILNKLACYYHTTSETQENIPDEIISKIKSTSSTPTFDELINNTYYYRIRRFFGFNKNKPNFPDWCTLWNNTEFLYVQLTQDLFGEKKDTKFAYSRNTFFAHVMCVVTS